MGYKTLASILPAALDVAQSTKRAAFVWQYGGQYCIRQGTEATPFDAKLRATVMRDGWACIDGVARLLSTELA